MRAWRAQSENPHVPLAVVLLTLSAVAFGFTRRATRAGAHRGRKPLSSEPSVA